LKRKLKIAIVGSRGYPYVYSGYETLTKELSERLIKKGHNVRVYCHSSLFKEKPKIVNGIELIYTPSIKSKFFSQLFNSFFSFLHICFSRIDVVLVVNSANGPFGFLTKIFRKKTCVNVDGLEWLRPKWKGLGSIYFKISSKLSTLLFDEVITDSIEMNKIYLKKFKKKSNVIAYGSTMLRTRKKNILEKYNLKEKEYYLIVGRLIPDNNSNLILNGFLKFKSNKKIVVVGDVPYNDNYAKMTKLMNNEYVIMTGYINSQENLTQLYKNCYGYIHGHEFGGTNPTMINALDLNCKIIALDTIFNREMLINKNAIFFEKKISSVKNALNNFEVEYDLITKKDSNYILSNKYKWDNITQKYLDVFNKITNSQNK
jgi:glycosyltransferase involved in cell wall biosynthesis